MELGKKIKQLRYKAGLTQEQLADKLGIVPQSVSKWENGATMPDITTLPLLAEIFGVSIDDLFDMSAEQRFNRIENRLDLEDDLPSDVFREYEDYLKEQMNSDRNKKRAVNLIAFLYWHRMDTYARKVRRFAGDAVLMAPDEKGCQWMLQKAAGHAAWDWNITNHTDAIEFYREIVEKNPKMTLPYAYLLDNLIADHRADEAEEYLDQLCTLKSSDPITNQVYRAHIALARFDKAAADRIIEELIAAYPDSFVCLFEAAQYYAKICCYKKAVDCYEKSFEMEQRRPRFQDELQGIADIYEITGNYLKAAETYERIIDLLQNEWKMTDEAELQYAKREKTRLFDKASKKKPEKSM